MTTSFTALFTAHKVEFVFWQLPSARSIKVVLRRIPYFIDLEEVKSELTALGFILTKVVRLMKRKEIPTPLVLVVLPPSEQNLSFSKRKELLDFCHISRVSLEKFRGSSVPIQCFNCQAFYHSSLGCRLPPKCLVCAGNLYYRDCDKRSTGQIKCINCNGAHTANYGGCPKVPKLRKTGFSYT